MTHGPDAVHRLVDDAGWSYPVSAERLERNYALENVQIDERGNTMMLSELLVAADVDRFENREDVERKLAPVFEAESEARDSGIVGRLKRTFLG
jgi:hypothetical protein